MSKADHTMISARAAPRHLRVPQVVEQTVRNTLLRRRLLVLGRRVPQVELCSDLPSRH